MSITNFPVAGTIGTTLRPKRFDLEVYQGDTFTFNLVLKGDGGTPLNLDGWTGIAQIKTLAGSPGATPNLDIEIGDEGVVVISLTGTDSSALVAGDGPYGYDVQLTDTAGNKRTFIGGTITVTEGRVIAGTATAADTGTHSANESSTLFKAIALSDNGTHSGVEVATISDQRPTMDTGIHTVVESASVTLFGVITKTGSDSGVHSTSEVASESITLSRSDTGAHSANEQVAGASTGSASDTVSVSANEASQIAAKVATDDSGAHVVSEETDIVTFQGVAEEVWNGTEMVPAHFYVWDGTKFSEVTKYIWNGTDWS